MAFVNLRLGASATWTNADVPLKLNACPTSPGPNVVPPCSTPLLLPTLSFALPSPFHQLTKPEETGAQFVGGGPVGHFPALPAVNIAAISFVPNSRLYSVTSSICPLKSEKMEPTALKPIRSGSLLDRSPGSRLASNVNTTCPSAYRRPPVVELRATVSAT